MSKAQDDADLLDVATKTYALCYGVVDSAFRLRIFARQLSLQRKTAGHAVIVELAQALRRLNRLCNEADEGMAPVRAAFRAAFDPPCLINDTAHHSFHEGVLYIAKYDVAAIDERTIDENTIAALVKFGVSIPDPEQLRASVNQQKSLAQDDGTLEQYLQKKWKMEVRRIQRVNIDVSSLLCALDKEIAKVAMMLRGTASGAATPVPWSKPRSLGAWAEVLGVSKNTATARLRELERDGVASKRGGGWCMDQRYVKQLEEYGV